MNANNNSTSTRNVAQPRWVLTSTIEADGNPRKILVQPLPFSVGRRPDADLTISRRTISSFHAEFFQTADGLCLRDLGSTNGTFVNGYRVDQCQVLEPGDIIQFADATYQLVRDVDWLETGTMRGDFCDQALATCQFSRLMQEHDFVPFFQPITDLASGAVLAYEVLARSRFAGLQTGGTLFSVAEELGRAGELSMLMREKGIEDSERFDVIPHLFLNTHPTEVANGAGDDWLEHLHALSPMQPMTIEIHEGATTDLPTMLRLRSRTQELGLGLAFDDFGVGQARIAEVWEIRPDYVKFDRRMIEKIDEADAKRFRFVASLVDAVQQIGVQALAEGIETEGELQACRELGFVLGQGYLLGRPLAADAYAHAVTTA